MRGAKARKKTPHAGRPPLIAGRYRLGALLGRGGMAEVWEAHDVRLARTVAIKFLTVRGPGEDADATRRRFLREARLVASVCHANVVNVLDFGGDQDDLPYMVMEILRGESLDERLRRAGSIELGEMITIMSEVLAGLGAIHEAGIVHRDLKPANLILIDDPDAPRVKLIDFGVSKAGLDQRSAVTTHYGQLVGTPAYMASEQAQGRDDVDRRADLYSVGAILYESLTGRLPFQAPATGDLIIAIATGGAPSVVALRPEVGPAISDVIARAMHVERESRYPSADAMRIALLEAGAKMGTNAKPAHPLFALTRKLRSSPPPANTRQGRIGQRDREVVAARGTRRRWLVRASAAAAAMGLAGGAAGLWISVDASARQPTVERAPAAALTPAGRASLGEVRRADVPDEVMRAPVVQEALEPLDVTVTAMPVEADAAAEIPRDAPRNRARSRRSRAEHRRDVVLETATPPPATPRRPTFVYDNPF